MISDGTIANLKADVPSHTTAAPKVPEASGFEEQTGMPHLWIRDAVD